MSPPRHPPRPHPLARARWVDRLDTGLNRAWDNGWLPRVPLDADELLARAFKGYDTADLAAGRADDDVADFTQRLHRLCASVKSEAKLNAVGHAFAYGLLSRAIHQRLALGAVWRKQPQLVVTQIAPPIIVVGQMRSGTTRIHRLLASDPAHSATRFCDSWHAVPARPDIRPLIGGVALAAARMLDPWIDALHPFGAARADEELGWLACALSHCAYEAQWHIPSYTAFSEARDPAPIYREFARILRTDAAHHGSAAKPRILKVPQFTEDLDALLGELPHAKIIVSRRSDDDTLKSSVSLVANQMAIQSDDVSLERIEQEWRRKIALRESRVSRSLANYAGPVAELDFDRLGHNWVEEITRLYKTLGLRLTKQALAAMHKEQSANSRSAHHQHGPQLASFGDRSTSGPPH
ncbi:sulfotransferase [Pontixanthobacter sp.]|uniref:sulfotransferase n=1 Tax=Pontixanthobacter sp. TaxID=2792078 RepID=UPI003C79F369